jgi:hypothetical protein
MLDDHGEVCAGGMFTDRVARLDPKTSHQAEASCFRGLLFIRVFEQAANQLL